jgi:hypothetical protein
VPIVLPGTPARPVPTTPLIRPEEWPNLEEARAGKQATTSTRSNETGTEASFTQLTAKGRISDFQFIAHGLPFSMVVRNRVKESKPRVTEPILELYNSRMETQTRTPKEDRKKG